MPIISKHPRVVCWRLMKCEYAMMEVSPQEVLYAKKRFPDLLGIPYMYAISDDDVEWFPDSMDGGPVVR